ncbi:MAG: putative quinol monooxygenase [Roseiarcus sp.]|jgi:quinol monooxygenase YgiN
MLVVIATMQAKPGMEDAFRRTALELVERVNAEEEGCLQYTLCAGDDPLSFTFVERYKDDSAVQAHRKSEHFRTLGRRLGEAMDGPPSITRLQQISEV